MRFTPYFKLIFLVSILLVCLSGPTPDEIAHFRKVFDLIDADQDGVINKSEMKAVMALIGHDVTDHDVKVSAK